MAIKRDIETEVRKYLLLNQENSDVLLLSGARQVGKTTLIEEILRGSNAIIVNLYERTMLPRLIDAAETFEEIEGVLRREINFVPSRGVVLVIDEAQESKRLGRWIRFFKERWKNQKVILLGSILSNLFEEDVAYPVGRVQEIVLRPFSFREYLAATGREGLIETLGHINPDRPLSENERTSFIKPYLDYLQTGGMPDVVMGVKEQRELARISIERLIGHYAVDVERYLGEPYKTMFLSALDMIADITCHPIKNSQIISTSSPSYRKLPRLLEIMEKWHLVHRIGAQTKQPESQLGMAPKRYIFDTGITNLLVNHGLPLEWSLRSAGGNIAFAKLQENFVCNEIMASHPEPLGSLCYYKDTRNSQEVDFILTIGDRAIPIEVKSSTSISKNGLIPMCNFLEQRGFKTGILAYNGEMKTMELKGKKIHAMPAFCVTPSLGHL